MKTDYIRCEDCDDPERECKECKKACKTCAAYNPSYDCCTDIQAYNCGPDFWQHWFGKKVT